MGPFDHWPTGGGGFEQFYGSSAARPISSRPAIYDDTTPVEPDETRTTTSPTT